MYFKQILDERCGCASYVIASRETHEAAVVDPSIHLDEYESILRERDFTLRYVIDTHVHADHVSGGRALVAAHPGAELCLYRDTEVAYPFRPLDDGEEVPLGQLRLRVLHTPGHRSELISLLIVNPPRSPEPSMVLTADSLLVGDVGRPDFGGGAATDQYDSLTKLLRLPDWVAVFPGHFEGPCGKGMCGRPSTTIGFERLFNPLARMSRAEFLEAVSGGVPARPLNMVAIEATNRGVVDLPWAMPTQAPPVEEVGVDALERNLESAVLIDVREPEEYAQGHVPGAVNVPQAELATRIDELPRDREILTICRSGGRSLRSAQWLKQAGFARVRSVADGTDGWSDSGRPLATTDDAHAAAAGPQVRDSRWTHAGIHASVA
ncbi:MAG TPA: MBL fold metallo-hydrolase [Chloroflexota bacterium]|nr:MBL fold metallo-hydrolase [Chloroflexota bacterium]